MSGSKFVSFYLSSTNDFDDVKYKLGTQWKSGTVKKRLAKAALEATKGRVRVRTGALQASGFANSAGRVVFPKDYAGKWWDKPVDFDRGHSPENSDAVQNPHLHEDVTNAVKEETVDILNEMFT